MAKQNGGPDGTPEGSEIRRNIIDGGDKSLVHDMGDSYEDAPHAKVADSRRLTTIAVWPKSVDYPPFGATVDRLSPPGCRNVPPSRQRLGRCQGWAVLRPRGMANCVVRQFHVETCATVVARSLPTGMGGGPTAPG